VRHAWLANLSLALVATLSVLLAGELAFRVLYPPTAVDPSFVPLQRLCDDCGYVYELNPAMPQINYQGLRGRTYPIPKPPGAFRILLLGDSVAFGMQVRGYEMFSSRLEEALGVEVVNTAVSGYSTFTERMYFRERGVHFEPDLVLVAVCLNDVVDPLPHWNRGLAVVGHVPPEAIPNPRYHEEEVMPRFRYRQWKARLAARSALFRRFSKTLLPRIEQAWPFENVYFDHYGRLGGEGWPTHLTGDDDLGIEVLTDWESAEWRWLRAQLDALAAEVRAAGARFAILVFPLQYQLDADYPYLPQALFRRYCESRELPCLDLLPPLRAARRGGRTEKTLDDLFIDEWHLTPRGHRVAADAIERFLKGAGLVRRAARHAPG